MILIVYIRSHKALTSSKIQCVQEGLHTFCILQCASIWIDSFYTSCHGYRLSYLLCAYPHSAIQSNSAFKWKSPPQKGKEEMSWIQKTKDGSFSNVSISHRWTHSRHIFRLQRTTKPPFNSPKPSDFLVWASKHSSSGSMSLWARDTRAYTRHPT